MNRCTDACDAGPSDWTSRGTPSVDGPASCVAFRGVVCETPKGSKS